MPRTNYVKKAQARYRMVPVLNEDGTPKKIAVLARNGQPKKTKTGREVTRRLTVADKSQPLPNRRCDKCGRDIETGDAYKWIKPKSGPYGGSKRYRCASCPTWKEWEYSNSLSARTAKIEADAWDEAANAETSDDLRTVLESAAEAIRELAEEKRESAQNIVDGFGHDTYQSEELTDQADQLDSWADDVENTDPGEVPEECPDQEDEDHDEDDCEACREYNDFDFDNWREEALYELQNCPV